MARCWQGLVMGATLCGGCTDTVYLELLEPRDLLEAGVARDAGAPRRDAGDDDLDSPSMPVGGFVPSIAPVVRYAFSGWGTTLRDEMGAAHAQILGGARLSGTGSLTLDGVDDYVDLPNGFLSQLTSATIVVWLEWYGGVCWQRVFDIGGSDAGEGRVGDATAALFMSPSTCNDGLPIAEMEQGDRRFRALAEDPFPEGRQVQVAVSFDAARERLTLFLDGVPAASTEAHFALRELDDVNSWLGRSQWRQDHFAGLRYDELRLYDRALDEAEISELLLLGPDQL